MSSGQPRVENGHRPELNQVSKMSGSCVSSAAGRPQTSQASGPCRVGRHRHVAVRAVPGRDAMAPPQLAGHVPVADVRQPVLPGLLEPLGQDPRPPGPRVASSARAASGSVRMNHCVLRRGSMTSSLRWQRPMTISWGCSSDEVAAGVEVGHDRLAGLVAVEAVVAACRCSRSSRRRRGSSASAGRGAGRSRSRRGRGPA